MKKTRGRVIEVDSVEELDQRIAAGAMSMSGWHVRSVDLTGRGEVLRSIGVAGALFLGCTFAAADEVDVRSRGGIVFPVVPDQPFDTYRSRLYSPAELYDTADYQHSLDARAYAWSRRPADCDATLAAALHDHAIDDALGDWVASRRLVGVMGGHAVERGTGVRRGRRLGRALAAATSSRPAAGRARWRRRTSARGCPGATRPRWTRHWPCSPTVPSFRPVIGAWARTAFESRRGSPTARSRWASRPGTTVTSRPTPFATAIAKYFHNSTREAILLEVCDAGIVFLPGAGGTVQEIFQDACENYYADESSVAPMVLVGRAHWTGTVPAWPLLQALARGPRRWSRTSTWWTPSRRRPP